MKRIIVTGGSGKAGRAVIKELVEQGYEVVNVDLLPPRERLTPYLKTDLTDLGQVFEVLHGADALVHLGPFQPLVSNQRSPPFGTTCSVRTMSLV